MGLRSDCDYIVKMAIEGVKPDVAVEKALSGIDFSDGHVTVIAIGKAAWTMAKSAKNVLGQRAERGAVITKYGHSCGEIDNFDIYEAGHPVPDDNTFRATRAVLDMTGGLSENDTVLFLISGGGSAIFEEPLISREELESVTNRLLACGADIVEINTIRKRFSNVKGGRFAKHCSPARVFSVVLSDILGDPLDMIASGPAYPDSSTCEQAFAIADKYSLMLTARMRELLGNETPKKLENTESVVIGSVRELCSCAAQAAQALGYTPVILTDSLNMQAREAGAFLAAIARYNQDTKHSLAFIAGGETVVQLTGTGKGGRNQELAFGAAEGIKGLRDTAIFSVGSDGTDGPTDAAGGYVDGDTAERLSREGILIYDVLKNNDSYNALAVCDGLIVTGATGTNVNDVSVVLIKR